MELVGDDDLSTAFCRATLRLSTWQFVVRGNGQRGRKLIESKVS